MKKILFSLALLISSSAVLANNIVGDTRCPVQAATLKVYNRSNKTLENVTMFTALWGRKETVHNVKPFDVAVFNICGGECVTSLWWRFAGTDEDLGMTGNIAGCLGDINYHITENGVFIGAKPLL